MKRQVANGIAIVAGIILCIGVVFIVTHPEKMDDVVLLEKQHPGYWDTLSQQKSEKIFLPSDYSNTYDQESLHNILIDIGFISTSNYGISLLSNNESVTVSGRAEESFWPSLTKNDFDLEEGIYYFLPNKLLGDDSQIYLEGRTGTDHRKFAYYYTKTGEYINSFSLKDNEYDFYKVGLSISSGDIFESFVISPILYKISNTNVSSNVVYLWRVDKTAFSSLTKGDKMLFNNWLKNNEAEWYSIIFEDQTGIQIINNAVRRGEIDDLGRVEDNNPLSLSEWIAN